MVSFILQNMYIFIPARIAVWHNWMKNTVGLCRNVLSYFTDTNMMFKITLTVPNMCPKSNACLTDFENQTLGTDFILRSVIVISAMKCLLKYSRCTRTTVVHHLYNLKMLYTDDTVSTPNVVYN